MRTDHQYPPIPHVSFQTFLKGILRYTAYCIFPSFISHTCPSFDTLAKSLNLFPRILFFLLLLFQSTARGAFQTGTSEITTDLPTVSTYNDNDSKEQNTEHQLHFHEVLPADDADNKALLEHVHPPEHKNPVDDDVYDVIAIGGGAAGLVCTSGVVRHGGKGALIEYSLLGGDCLNIGCVPSKALLSCSKMAASLNKMSKYGLLLSSSSTSSSSSDSSDASNSHPSVTVDFAAIMQRMRNLRAKIAPNDGVPRFNGLGADVYLGHAKFTSPNTVEVTADDKTKTTLKFRKVRIEISGCEGRGDDHVK